MLLSLAGSLHPHVVQLCTLQQTHPDPCTSFPHSPVDLPLHPSLTSFPGWLQVPSYGRPATNLANTVHLASVFCTPAPPSRCTFSRSPSSTESPAWQCAGSLDRGQHPLRVTPAPGAGEENHPCQFNWPQQKSGLTQLKSKAAPDRPTTNTGPDPAHSRQSTTAHDWTEGRCGRHT